MTWSFRSRPNGHGWLHNVTAGDNDIKPKRKEVNKLKHFLTNKWTDLLKSLSVTSQKCPVSFLSQTVSVAYWFLFLHIEARRAPWPSCFSCALSRCPCCCLVRHDTVCPAEEPGSSHFQLKLTLMDRFLWATIQVIVALRAPGRSAFSWWNWNFQ